MTLELGLTSPGGLVFLASLSVLLVAAIHDAARGPWPGWAKLAVTVLVMGGVFASTLMPL